MLMYNAFVQQTFLNFHLLRIVSRGLYNVPVHGSASEITVILRNLKAGIGSLFDPCVMLWGGCHSDGHVWEASYSTSGFGTIA